MASSQDPTNPPVSRRLPPPCWSPDETVALIDAYRDKWYSLRRGNLRAPHWQEVADGVADRCPSGTPPKTSIQCRHKMEKLRKRYRSEIQRITNTPNGQRYPSSWVHFEQIDSMELGSCSSDPSINEENDDNQHDLMLYPKGNKQAIAIPLNQNHRAINNGDAGIVTGKGFRIKIPNIAPPPPPPPPRSGLNLCNSKRPCDDYPPLMNPHYRSSMNNNGGNPVDEMVEAIQMLGNGFVKVERMKMDMARELESMRMKMEMKRTEMILESHQKLVDSFAKTVLEKKSKKIKRIPTPES